MNNDSEIERFTSSLLVGNRKECLEMAESFFSKSGSIIDLYEQLIKPSLYKVGELWEYNRITVADEHLATAISESILNQFVEQIISSTRSSKSVLVCGIEGEHHQVGAKMVADVFEMAGWNATFLGVDLPLNELIKYAQKHQPNLIALSVSVYMNMSSLLKTIQRFSFEFPDLLIVVGGQAFLHVGTNLFKNNKNVLVMSDLYELNEFIIQEL